MKKKKTRSVRRIKPDKKAELPTFVDDKLAAEWLAITNLAYPGKTPTNIFELRAAISSVVNCPDEAEGAVADEASYWIGKIRERDPFAVGEVAKELPFLVKSWSNKPVPASRKKAPARHETGEPVDPDDSVDEGSSPAGW